MKLTTTQIDHLYTFTHQHYVEWYDLQSELVDHLANAIEMQWQENPKLTFDEALNKEFQKFGIFGFMDVIDEKRKALGKKYNLMIWSHFKEFFGIPKIIWTSSTIGIIYMILKSMNDPSLFVFGSFFVLMGLIFYKLFQNKKSLKQENKKWLFKEIIFNYGSANGIIILLFQILNSSFWSSEQFLGNKLFLVLMAAFLVFLIVFGYIILFLIPSKADEYLQETYPEYELEKTQSA